MSFLPAAGKQSSKSIFSRSRNLYLHCIPIITTYILSLLFCTIPPVANPIAGRIRIIEPS